MLTESKTNDSMTIIYIYERLDDSTSQPILAEIDNTVKQNSENDILLNLKEVDYISSPGIRVLIKIKDLVEKNNKKLMLCNLNSNVKNVLDVVDIMDVFNIYDSEDDVFDNI